jgi:hypothetical protein
VSKLVTTSSAPQSADPVGSVSTHQQLVINLCTLPAPITVPQPRASQLTRYSFFMSHFWADGRRQYRLHMGYFRSTAEAEKWLVTLKRVYPNAHIGEAPETRPDLMGNTQRLRVLAIGHVGEHPSGTDDVGNSGTRAGTSAQQRPAGPESPAAKELHAKPTTVHPTGRRSSPSLEDTLEELRTSEFDMGSGEDDLNSTGVRHLRVEVQKDKTRARAPQRPGSRTRG